MPLASIIGIIGLYYIYLHNKISLFMLCKMVYFNFIIMYEFKNYFLIIIISEKNVLYIILMLLLAIIHLTY